MGKPETIGIILESVLGKLKGKPLRDEVERVWRQLLGKKAAGTKIAELRQGELLVAVGSSSLFHELSLQKGEILLGFEKSFGKGVVKDIRLQIGDGT